jgi:hypothetical protein
MYVYIYIHVVAIVGLFMGLDKGRRDKENNRKWTISNAVHLCSTMG